MNHELKYFLYLTFTYGIAAITLQSVLVPYIDLYGWRPDLVLIITLFIGMRFGSVYGSSFGFIMGLLQDSLSPLALGITALPKALAGYGTGKIKILKFSGSVVYLWHILFIFLHELITYLILSLRIENEFTLLLYTRVFPNTVYTTVLMIIFGLLTFKTFSFEES